MGVVWACKQPLRLLLAWLNGWSLIFLDSSHRNIRDILSCVAATARSSSRLCPFRGLLVNTNFSSWLLGFRGLQFVDCRGFPLRMMCFPPFLQSNVFLQGISLLLTSCCVLSLLSIFLSQPSSSFNIVVVPRELSIVRQPLADGLSIVVGSPLPSTSWPCVRATLNNGMAVANARVIMSLKKNSQLATLDASNVIMQTNQDGIACFDLVFSQASGSRGENFTLQFMANAQTVESQEFPVVSGVVSILHCNSFAPCAFFFGDLSSFSPFAIWPVSRCESHVRVQTRASRCLQVYPCICVWVLAVYWDHRGV